MYGELADWFHVLTAPADYDVEAKLFRRTLVERSGRRVRSVLELGSGGGNNASWLKRSFRLTLVDLSPGMLDVSRRINPECEHVEGDMRTVRLGRTFDAVFVHDAIGYMLTRGDLSAAMATAYAHLRPGGVALFVPDWIRETFQPRTTHGGHDVEGRSLRYLEWTRDPDPDDDRITMSFSYLLSEKDGPVRPRFEEHELGVFPRRVWLARLRKAGFAAEAVPYEESSFDPPVATEMFVGLRGEES